ncbi:MAG: alpha-2-macroglobulin family protein, partial [Thermoanaerobaculia bacterium]
MLSRRRRAFSVALGFAFVAATLVMAGSASGPTPTAAAPSGWKDIDRLVAEQKFEEAANAVARLREAAIRAGNEAEWTKALIREVQLRTGLHGYETAARFLKEQPWPAGLLPRTSLELFYAQSLVNYFHSYSWEIQQRERVESTGVVDLKAWTGQQIYAEAVRAYLRVWQEREALGREDVKALSEFVEANDYPAGVRSTLRDAVSYFFAAHLADSSGWSPAQSNEVFRLDLAALLLTGAPGESVKLDDDAAHPLARLAAVLEDLEAWHGGRDEREGELEAHLERLRRLFSSFTEEEDRRRIETHLEELLPAFAGVPWWAMGKAQLAEFVERPDQSGDLVRARAIAQQGRRAYPSSVGGQRCVAIIKRIEAPEYQLRTMQSDGERRRSILVSHKNIGKILFRAFAIDLPARIQAARNQYAIFPSGDELKSIVDTRTPAAQWSVALLPTPDYRLHATYVTPPMREPGCYVVAASGAASFGGPGSPLVAANFILTDLVVVSRQIAPNAKGSNGLEVQALSGRTGKPLAGVATVVLRTLWNPERIERLSSGETDAGGLVVLPSPADRQGSGAFIFARQGVHIALDMSVYFPYGSSQAPTTASLIFTDRSIYRPLQKISWKVLGYRGDARAGRFEVFPASPVTV